MSGTDPVADAQRPAAGGEQDGRFYPGALVMPDSNARVAHVILTLNGTDVWWYALCNRNGRTDGKFGDRSFIAQPGTPICARCKARLATTSEVTS